MGFEPTVRLAADSGFRNRRDQPDSANAPDESKCARAFRSKALSSLNSPKAVSSVIPLEIFPLFV